MSRACSVWMDELFNSDLAPKPQVVAASGGNPSAIPSPYASQGQLQPQQQLRKQPIPPNLFEGTFLFARRSLHQIFPSLVDAPFLDALMANGLPTEESDDEDGGRENDAGSSLRPASSKDESSGETVSSGTSSSSGQAAQVTTLTIHGLPRKLDLPGLQEAFASAGFVFEEAIDYALLPKRGISQEGGIPCRHAFVNFTTVELANAAKAAWHGKEVSFPGCGRGERDAMVLRLKPSKVQGLDKNLKINAKDAWVSTLPSQASYDSKTQGEPKKKIMSSKTSAPTSRDAAGQDQDGGEGTNSAQPIAGTKIKTKRQNRSTNKASWQG